MYSTSINLDDTVKLLIENELGILLLTDSEPGSSYYHMLVEKSTFEDRLGVWGNNMHITYHLFPVVYNKPALENQVQNLVSVRSNAIYNVFDRWCSKGYNIHHAKSPYSCTAFQRYLNEIEFMKADYMLLLVD